MSLYPMLLVAITVSILSFHFSRVMYPLSSVTELFPPPSIQRLIRTSDHAGWASTNDTIYRWEIHNGSTRFEKKLELGTPITHFIVNEPELYVCSSTNVYGYNTKSRLFTSLLGKVGYSPHPLRSKQITTLPYHENRILNCRALALSHDKQYLYVADQYDYESFIWKLDLKPSQCVLPVARGFYEVSHLLDTKNGLWVGEGRSLSRLTNRSIHTVSFPAAISDVLYDKGDIWVITQRNDQILRLLQFNEFNLTKTFDRHYSHDQLSRSTLYINNKSFCFTGQEVTSCVDK